MEVKSDIRYLKKKMRFGLYIKADSFNLRDCWDQSTDSCVFLKWDMEQLTFDNGKYWLKDIDLYSSGGYMDGVDRDHIWIKHDSSWNHTDEKVTLVYEYNWLDCGMSDSVMKVDIQLEFVDLESVGLLPKYECNLVRRFEQNRLHKTIDIQFKQNKKGRVYIYTLCGKLIEDIPVNNQKNLNIDYSGYNTGYYIIYFWDYTSQSTFRRKFWIKN